MFCLDTNIIIDLFRGDEALKLKIETLLHQEALFVPCLVVCELYKGAFNAEHQKEAVQLVDDFVDSVDVLEFTQEACKCFGREWASLKRMGKPTQEIDLMIASIAIAHNLTLVTRNKKHFENLSSLTLEIW